MKTDTYYRIATKAPYGMIDRSLVTTAPKAHCITCLLLIRTGQNTKLGTMQRILEPS